MYILTCKSNLSTVGHVFNTTAQVSRLSQNNQNPKIIYMFVHSYILYV